MSTPRATARVDAAAIRHNVAELRGRVASGQLLAVVKADGYGHGLLTAATAAVAGGAQWLGTALLQEALAAAGGRAHPAAGASPGCSTPTTTGTPRCAPTSTCPPTTRRPWRRSRVRPRGPADRPGCT